MNQNAADLYRIPEHIEMRWASGENPSGEKGAGGAKNAGRKGAAWFPLKAGETRVLADYSGGPGTFRRMWATMSDRSPRALRSTKIEFFWDGADKPAVSVPIGDFFGTGLGRFVAFQSAIFSSPEGRSFNTCLPMPFRKGFKVTITNESSNDNAQFFYDINFTVGDQHDDSIAYLHAHWRRENPTTMQKDFEILPRVTGRGRYIGTNIGVIVDTKTYARAWWGEGEVKIFVDGDRELPTLCGTGTEDYIGTGYGQGRYDHLYQGCHVADHEKFQYCFYRYHIPDPVYFRKDVRVTIQQIGCWDPENKPKMGLPGKPIYVAGPGLVETEMKDTYGLFERTDDWSSCAYFYLDRPTNDLPALLPVAERVAGI